MARDALITAIVLPLLTLILFLAAFFLVAHANFVAAAFVWLALAIPAWWLLLFGGRLLTFQVFRILAIGVPALAFGGCTVGWQLITDDGLAQPALGLLALGFEVVALGLFGSLAVIFAEVRNPNDRLGRRIGLATICLLFAFLAAVIGRAVIVHGAYHVISFGVFAVCAGMSMAALTAFAFDMQDEAVIAPSGGQREP
jgi:hypothetical protein